LAQALSDSAGEMLQELRFAEGPVLIEKFAPDAGDLGKIRQSDNPAWYIELYNAGFTNKDTIMNALQRILDQRDAGDYRTLDAVKRAVWGRTEEVANAYQEMADILAGKGKKVKDLELARHLARP
jgi:hypothetical protein